MDEIRIIPGRDYEGDGISRGLARGLLVFLGTQNLTGEGMGIGSVAVRNAGNTFFSRTWDDVTDPGTVIRTFTIDTQMSWTIRGAVSPALTRWIESSIDMYMRHPSFQRILMIPVLPLRNILNIHPVFEKIPARGQVAITCRINKDQVDVRAEIQSPVHPGDVVCLLNEVSAAWFTMAEQHGKKIAPPPAWEQIDSKNPPVLLYDPLHRIRFVIDRITTPLSVPSKVFWGREHTGDLCWAGFCIELGPLDPAQEPVAAQYTIRFTREECP